MPPITWQAAKNFKRPQISDLQGKVMRWKIALPLPLFRARHGAILSIGSIFHDSIGHIAPVRLGAPARPGLPVKPGTAFEAIGGSAYNVAANINQSESSWMLGASVFAVVSPNTFFERLLRAKLRRLPWETAHRIQYHSALTDSQGGHHVKGSYYISVVNHRVPTTQAGVVDHSLGSIDLFDTKECGAALSRAIAESSAIIASASMKPEQLDRIISECDGGKTQPKRPLFVTISSSYEGESLRARRSDKVKCIAVRYEVARNILTNLEQKAFEEALQNAVINRMELSISEATTLCDLFSAQHLLVTYLTEGIDEKRRMPVAKGAVLVLTQEHGARLIDLDEVLGKVTDGNLVGVSDAIMAGFIEAYVDLASRDIFPLEDLSINVAEKGSFLKERMIPHVMRVIDSNGPTLGSVLNPDKRSATAQGFKRVEQWLREQLWDYVKYAALASFIVLVLSFFSEDIKAKLCQYEQLNRLLYSVCKGLEKSEGTPR
jgi:hypothetical protein